MAQYVLSPAYDLMDTRIHVDEDGFFALTYELIKEWYWSDCTINNAQHHPRKEDFVVFARKIGIAGERVDKLIASFLKEQAGVEILVQRSFLDEGTKVQYVNHYHERLEMLNLI